MRTEFDKPTLVLASASPRRAELLTKAGIEFVKMPSNIDEEEIHKRFRQEDVNKRYTKNFAKEMALAKLSPFVGTTKNGAVITADTVVYFDGRIIGKPHTKEKCREQHQLLGGTTSYAITAVAVHYNGRTVYKVTSYPVKIAPLPDDVIETICNEPYTLECAGYRSSGAIGPYMRVNKNYYQGVAGLDLPLLRKMLKKVKFPLNV